MRRPTGTPLAASAPWCARCAAMGKEAIVLNADPTPRKFAYLDAEKLIRVLEREEQIPADIGEYSLLMLDTNDVHNIGQIATQVLPRVREHFIIDHHEKRGGSPRRQSHQEERLLDLRGHLPDPERDERRHRYGHRGGAVHGDPLRHRLLHLSEDHGHHVRHRAGPRHEGRGAERGLCPRLREQLGLRARPALTGPLHPRAGLRQPRRDLDHASGDDH